jgi:hypothetical protein
MKRALILLASALVLAATCISGGYRLGKGRERRITNSMVEGSFVNNLGALESLRAGDTATAIRKLEAHVFSSATLLLNQANAKHAALDVFRPSLLTYRHTYRTNPAEWTPMEQKLEQLLSSSQ